MDVAANGQEAEELAGVYPYDALIMDWNLPKLDGISALRGIRERKSGVPVLMLTATKSNRRPSAGVGLRGGRLSDEAVFVCGTVGEGKGADATWQDSSGARGYKWTTWFWIAWNIGWNATGERLS